MTLFWTAGLYFVSIEVQPHMPHHTSLRGGEGAAEADVAIWFFLHQQLQRHHQRGSGQAQEAHGHGRERVDLHREAHEPAQ